MIKTFLTWEEIQQMRQNAESLRDQLVITFLGDSGCRVSEMLKVKVENVDLEGGVVLIHHLKRGLRKTCHKCGKSTGRSQKFCSYCGADVSKVIAVGIEERSRLINIGADTVSLIQEYITAKKLKPSNYLINLTRQSVYYIVRRLANSIGIKGKAMLNPETRKHHYVHPHDFRASLATEWLTIAKEDVGKQKALQEHLGHKNFETTMRYHKLKPSRVKTVRDEIRKAMKPKGRKPLGKT